MDIHRGRFVPYPPSAINCLAFSHSTGSSLAGQPLRLAIGRENGDIEIWDPKNGAWICEMTFRGGKERGVQGLCWVQEPDEVDEIDTGLTNGAAMNGYGKKSFVTHGRLRLFSIGYSSTVTEWDLCTGLPRLQSSGNHSEVWCLAAQPRWKKSKKLGNHEVDDGEYRGQNLVLGCADGTIVLLSTADEGLTFSRFIARASKKNARALSMRFQNRNNVVVGFSDSTIRVYDIRNGSLLRTMSLGAGAPGMPKEKLVWAIECLRNGDIVAADSSGEITFWDGTTYGQLQRIKGHEADALCLAASEDGTRVFSGGMDRKTCVYNCTIMPQSQRRRQWSMGKHQRMHEHDVKAMASFDSKKSMSVVVSGGLDTQPVIMPLRQFGVEHHRALPLIPQDPPIAGAKRMLVSWWQNQVTVWRIGRRRREMPESDFQDVQPNYQTVAQLSLKGEENIAAATIAPSGKLLAVASSAEIKVFTIEARSGAATGHALKITKLDLPKSMSKIGARIVHFSQDSKWLLFVRHNNTINVARIVIDAESQVITIIPTTIELERSVRSRPGKDGQAYQNCLNGSWGSYDSTITRAAFSSDSRILALSDLSGNVDTFVLEGNEDSAAAAIDVISRATSSVSDSSDDEDESQTIIVYGQHWALNPASHLLPRLPSHALVLSFRPGTKPTTYQPGQVNGNPGIHPTRHNPHAHSNALPTSSDPRLFIVTALHQLMEFNVLTGRLTDWSRRNNDEARLPEEFRLLRDRAIGSFWDVQDATTNEKPWERLWVYGANWLSMFDLAQDLPAMNPSLSISQQEAAQTSTSVSDPSKPQIPSRKRKASSLISRSRKKSDATPVATALNSKHSATSGAGSQIIKPSEFGTGVSAAKSRKLDRAGKEVIVDLPATTLQPSQTATDDEEEEEDDVDDMDLDEPSSALISQPSQNGEPKEAKNKAFHLTLRYRPILGVIPLTPLDEWEAKEVAGDDVQYEVSDATLEVALIERPLWDLDLGERVVGSVGKEVR
jgi:U3 small nucleolar RNA-associated protein 4